MTTASDETILSVVRDLVPAGDGVLALVEETDVDSGRIGLRLYRLDARGEGGEADLPDGGMPVALAGLALRFPEAAIPRAGAALAKAAPEGLRAAAGDGTVLFALTGDPDVHDGAAQRLLRVRTGTARQTAPKAIDLGPLALSGGRMVTGLVLAGGLLHVFVADPAAGFAVFRTRADATKPVLAPVLDRGAQRFALNAMISAASPLSEDAGGLLLGTAPLAGGPVQAGDWGPEILHLDPGDGWEIVAGQPRFTPQGLKRPLSGRMPGFGQPGNAAVKAIATGQAGTFAVLQDFLGESLPDRRGALPDLLDYMGPVRIFRATGPAGWEDLPSPDLPGDAGSVGVAVVTGAGVILGHEGVGAGRVPVTFVSP
ncbi:MAG: hypothetical protein JJT81_00050 [Rubellimicrobium sp.]|nr:hypothetical protein [Rubellimicrobium sp.]